jgi:probable phosphoglycerate mutase
MPPPLPSSENLKNKYYLLRHGQSTANVAEIISSARSLAYTDTHGLTDTGYQQGKDSAKQLLDLLDSEEERKDNKSRRLVFVSSPFARAKQTAQACVDGLKEAHLERLEKNKNKLSDLQLDEEIAMEDRLVERYFGRLDAQAIYTYAYVWPLDQFNVTHTAFDVESVAAVCHRIFAIVQDCEQQYKDCHLVLVSHADVLQIAQLYAAGADNVGLFSAYRFKNGEVRPMIVGSTNHLPDPLPLEAPDRGTSLFTKAAYDISTRER